MDTKPSRCNLDIFEQKKKVKDRRLSLEFVKNALLDDVKKSFKWLGQVRVLTFSIFLNLMQTK